MRVKITRSPNGEHDGKFGHYEDSSYGPGLWMDAGFCEKSIHIENLEGWAWEVRTPPAPEPAPKNWFPAPVHRWTKGDENEPFEE